MGFFWNVVCHVGVWKRFLSGVPVGARVNCVEPNVLQRNLKTVNKQTRAGGFTAGKSETVV